MPYRLDDGGLQSGVALGIDRPHNRQRKKRIAKRGNGLAAPQEDKRSVARQAAQASVSLCDGRRVQDLPNLARPRAADIRQCRTGGVKPRVMSGPAFPTRTICACSAPRPAQRERTCGGWSSPGCGVARRLLSRSRWIWRTATVKKCVEGEVEVGCTIADVQEPVKKEGDP